MTAGSDAKDELRLAAAREYKAWREALHGLNEEQTAEVCDFRVVSVSLTPDGRR